MTFYWLDQLRRIVWKELTSFSPFYGGQDKRFPRRKPNFAMTHTLGFTHHKDNIEWALRGNRLSLPF
jgi:hypothetical protein